MNIERVEQFYVRMPLKHPFETSFGREVAYDKVVLAVYAGGEVGYGESPVERLPYYSPETAETCWHVQREALIPALLAADFDHPFDLPDVFARVRGHNMAKAGLEAAVWSLFGAQTGRSLSEMIGGTRRRVDVGVSVGIQPSLRDLLARIESFLNVGYRRIKIKIKPGWDVEVVSAIRQCFGDIRLMVDANSAYTLDDIPLLKALDDFDLLMIEQPLAYDDVMEHATLQSALRTPVCLDESITTYRRAVEALTLKSCRIINIKPPRVGGITMARAIHDLCQEAGVPVWCGGLLESGIGRAANLAVASLPNFTLPGDISATDRYWHEDITEPPFTLNSDGTIDVPQGSGLGVDVICPRLDAVTLRREVYK